MTDPFLWLEGDADRVRAWSKQQKRATETMLAALPKPTPSTHTEGFDQGPYTLQLPRGRTLCVRRHSIVLQDVDDRELGVHTVASDTVIRQVAPGPRGEQVALRISWRGKDESTLQWLTLPQLDVQEEIPHLSPTAVHWGPCGALYYTQRMPQAGPKLMRKGPQSDALCLFDASAESDLYLEWLPIDASTGVVKLGRGRGRHRWMLAERSSTGAAFTPLSWTRGGPLVRWSNGWARLDTDGVVWSPSIHGPWVTLPEGPPLAEIRSVDVVAGNLVCHTAERQVAWSRPQEPPAKRSKPGGGAWVDPPIRGTRLWMSGTQRHRPCLVDVYGGFGAFRRPNPIVSTQWKAWGGTYILPVLPGDGGSQATDFTMQDTLTALIATLRWLRDEGRASSIGLLGTSNGGLLVAAAALQAPDLIDAVVCAAPVTDLIRFPVLGRGRDWMDTYGDPSDPEKAACLLRISPYHLALECRRALPPFLVLTGDSDDRVSPAHSRKLVAALQAGGANAHLRVKQNAGHSGAASTTEQTAEAVAAATFLVTHLFAGG